MYYADHEWHGFIYVTVHDYTEYGFISDTDYLAMGLRLLHYDASPVIKGGVHGSMITGKEL